MMKARSSPVSMPCTAIRALQKKYLPPLKKRSASHMKNYDDEEDVAVAIDAERPDYEPARARRNTSRHCSAGSAEKGSSRPYPSDIREETSNKS